MFLLNTMHLISYRISNLLFNLSSLCIGKDDLISESEFSGLLYVTVLMVKVQIVILVYILGFSEFFGVSYF